jgi:hypothetical protein
MTTRPSLLLVDSNLYDGEDSQSNSGEHGQKSRNCLDFISQADWVWLSFGSCLIGALTIIPLNLAGAGLWRRHKWRALGAFIFGNGLLIGGCVVFTYSLLTMGG